MHHQSLQEMKISLESSIGEHTACVRETILRHPYPSMGPQLPEGGDRVLHGVLHAARVAFYVPTLANLFRRYGNEDAGTLTATDIKLLQIAALFHDTGRMNDGPDHQAWEQLGALQLFNYLTRLGVERDIARDFAEAIANKDFDGTTWYELRDSTWHATSNQPHARKLLYSQLIHDADCLDIMRVHFFDGTYLIFYRDYASHDENAFRELVELIANVRSMVHEHGDYRAENRDASKRAFYETSEAYQRIEASVRHDHRVFSTQGSTPLTKETLVVGEEDVVRKLQYIMDQGHLFSRGCSTPSATRNKNSARHPDEFMAALEIRKVYRRPGVPTGSSKANSDKKHGNPLRSVALLGPGSEPFTAAGGLIIDENFKQVSFVSEKNLLSGRGKVSQRKIQKQEADEVTKNLQKLHRKIQLGGCGTKENAQTNNECTRDITHYDALFYSYDPNTRPLADRNRNSCEHHPGSPEIQAIFMLKEYEAYAKKHNQDSRQEKIPETLPIVEVSTIDNRIRGLLKVSDETILDLWAKAYQDALRKFIGKNSDIAFEETPKALEEIKLRAIYPDYDQRLTGGIRGIRPADANYSPELQKKLTERLEKVRAHVLNDFPIQTLKENSSELWSNDIFNHILRRPGIVKQCEKEIRAEIAKQLRQGNLFAVNKWNQEPYTAGYDKYFNQIKYSHMPIKLLKLVTDLDDKDLIQQTQTAALTHLTEGLKTGRPDYGVISTLAKFISCFDIQAESKAVIDEYIGRGIDAARTARELYQWLDCMDYANFSVSPALQAKLQLRLLRPSDDFFNVHEAGHKDFTDYGYHIKCARQVEITDDKIAEIVCSHLEKFPASFINKAANIAVDFVHPKTVLPQSLGMRIINSIEHCFGSDPVSHFTTLCDFIIEIKSRSIELPPTHLTAVTQQLNALFERIANRALIASHLDQLRIKLNIAIPTSEAKLEKSPEGEKSSASAILSAMSATNLSVQDAKKEDKHESSALLKKDVSKLLQMLKEYKSERGAKEAPEVYGWRIFGCFKYKKGDKVDAAEFLTNLLENKDVEGMLEKHEGALRQGELGKQIRALVKEQGFKTVREFLKEVKKAHLNKRLHRP
jgi:hypothetical protein